MSIECNITKDNADFYVEAYTDDRVDGETRKVRLAYIAGYMDHEQTEYDQVMLWLELRDRVKDVYSRYQDGEVTVKLVFKQDWVNV